MATARERLDISLISQVIRSYYNFTATLKNTDKAWIVAKWFLKLNQLKEFRLAIKINGISKEWANKKQKNKRQISNKKSLHVSN
jgi:hypothetical protein